jgi:hypothetical protein
MTGFKMNITKEALVLFLKSLPSDSYFEIISFGSNHSKLSPQGNDYGFEYTDDNVFKAIELVNNFDADFGGTDMSDPLKYSLNKVKL